jgi:hypothetical protein
MALHDSHRSGRNAAVDLENEAHASESKTAREPRINRLGRDLALGFKPSRDQFQLAIIQGDARTTTHVSDCNQKAYFVFAS